MPRAKKRSRPIPPNYDILIVEAKQKGKRNALASLHKCLKTSGLGENELKSFLRGVFDDTIDVSPEQDEEITLTTSAVHETAAAIPSTRLNAPTNKKASSYVSSNSRSDDDEHNEVCDVCEKGGDLLCCDTCSLVFHIACVRPKLPAVPKRRWSCAHCIADELAPGDMDASKRAIVAMKRLSAEVVDGSVESEKDGTSASAADILVSKSGKKYLVRKTVNDKVEEIGRFSSLPEAFSCLAPLSSKNDRQAMTMEEYDDDSDGKLWCTECIDDPEITICCFCGCQECFGKHDSEYLLLCDNCDAEFHTYCLQPQLVEIPEATWYCDNCSHMNEKTNEEEDSVEIVSSVAKYPSTTASTASTVLSQADSGISVKPMSRGRGRPPGSGRLARQQAEAAAAMVGGIGPLGILRSDGYGVRSRVFHIGIGDSLTMQLTTNKDTPLVVSADTAVEIVRKAGNGPLSVVDREVLQRLRRWGSRSDLQAVIAALREKHLELTEQVGVIDPAATDSEPIALEVEGPQGSRSCGERYGDFKKKN